MLDPFIFGITLLAPTATNTASGFKVNKSFWVTFLPSLKSTFWEHTEWVRNLIALLISFFLGGIHAKFNWPPRDVFSSNKITSWPFKLATRAASRPAGPPPTTTTFFLVIALVIFLVSSYPFSAFSTQLKNLRFWILSVHPLLQDIHWRISSNLLSFTLFTQSGSVSKVLPSPIISTLSASKILSAILGLNILPTVLTGIFTSFFIWAAISTKNPYGWIPIGGIVSAILPVWFAWAMWSISTPASSNHLANIGASFKSIPPLPLSGVTTENL